MDNRVFNVNGSGDDMLLMALKLAFLQESERCTCSGFQVSKEKGLILCWTKNDKGISPLVADLTAEQVLPMVVQWLKSDFAKEVELSEWCADADHDGSNSEGWQVYCEDWGHVNGQVYAICAVKPAFMWHGK